MLKLNKKVVILISVAVAIAIVIGIVKSCSVDNPVDYEYDVIGVGPVEKTVSVSGKLELYEEKIIKAEIPGKISGVYADFNSKISKGKLLVRINAPEVEEAYQSYVDTYRITQMDLQTWEQKYKTTKRLYDEGLTSKSEFQTVKLNYNTKLANFRQVQNTFEERKKNLTNRSVYSDVSGVVVQKWAELDKKIAPGTPLFQIAPTMKKMKLIIHIDEADIGYIKTGQKVSFTVTAYPDKVFSGSIEQVRLSPVNKAGVVTYQSLVICDNPEELLRPGMTATAIVNVEKKESVLRVPNQALVVAPKEKPVKPGQKFIWLFDSSIKDPIPMKRVEVKIGLVGDFYTEIKFGEVKKDQKVLVGIHNKLLN